MNDFMENTDTELFDCISGFHRYTFGSCACIVFASESLCEITGYCRSDFLSDNCDMYERIVHPDDVESYRSFLQQLSIKQQTLSLEYRIVCKDKTVKFVKDTMTSKMSADGCLSGVSVLADITELKAENSELRFLNDNVPCGFLKCTCEKIPKITYFNEQMIGIVRFPNENEGEIDYRELYSDNIYLMIPMDERPKFAQFLERAENEDTPVSGEISVVRCDGSAAVLYVWVKKAVSDEGLEEYQIMCMDITEPYRNRKIGEIERYVSALSDVYDKIFEYDFSNRTVKYIYGNETDIFGKIQNVPMQLEDATKQWLRGSVIARDIDRVEAFFAQVLSGKFKSDGNKPPLIRYKAVSSSGAVKSYMGIFLKIDDSVSYYCLKCVSDVIDDDDLRSENISLKNINQDMQELVMSFTEGLMAFELNGNRVRPLYVSDNVCNFFGYSQQQWLELTRHSVELDEFVSQSGVRYEDFKALIERGEGEFLYTDTATGTRCRIKAICSQKSAQNSSLRYVMLYNLDAESDGNNADKAGNVYIRTFGYFDVFVGGRPIAFRNKKSKELLALLVDRRGGFISSEDAISFLWEDEPVNSVTLARYRKVALRLKNILEEYGITDIMESVDGKRRIVPEKVRCDLYDYLSGLHEHASLFKGSYLTNYSWGEMTLGELMNRE